MRASSCSFVRRDSFLLMKSLSVALCDTLNSLQVSSMPRCSSFTSHRTFSRLTVVQVSAGECHRPLYYSSTMIDWLITCSSLVHIMEFIVKERHSLIFLSDHIGNIMKQRLLPVCWLCIQKLQKHKDSSFGVWVVKISSSKTRQLHPNVWGGAVDSALPSLSSVVWSRTRLLSCCCSCSFPEPG